MTLDTRFNPRARTGRDAYATKALSRSLRVSIHAPARGATHRRCRRAIARHCFNPRARTGRDALCNEHELHSWFQSTRPHGARLRMRGSSESSDRCFNPRARTGRDTDADTLRDRCVRRFNPRARTGRDAMSRCDRAAVFQSTRPHGARRAWHSTQSIERVSIHAPARGATR